MTQLSRTGLVFAQKYDVVDPGLLGAVARGNPRAWARLYEFNRKLVRSIVRSLVPRWAWDDVEQEAWLRIARKLPDYDPSRSALRTWVRMLTKTTVRAWKQDTTRKRRDWRLTLSLDSMCEDHGQQNVPYLERHCPSTSPTPEQDCVEYEMRTRVEQRATALLTPLQLRAYRMAQRGLGLEESARLVGVSRQAIGQLVEKAVWRVALPGLKR